MTTATRNISGDPNSSKNTMMIASLYTVGNKEVNCGRCPNGRPHNNGLPLPTESDEEEDDPEEEEKARALDTPSLPGPGSFATRYEDRSKSDSNAEGGSSAVLDQGNQGAPFKTGSQRKYFKPTLVVGDGGFTNSQDIRAVGDCPPNISN